MPGPPESHRNPAAPAGRFRRRWPASVGALLLGAAALVWAGTEWRARAASAHVRALAVLPFSGGIAAGNQWFAPAFTGEIIDRLARAPGLQVIGRASTPRLQAGGAKQFGVAATLEGNIQKENDRLRVSLTMNRVSDGYRLWSATFERPADDPYGAIAAIASAIAGRLQLAMPAARAPNRVPHTQAYFAYLEGRYWFDQATPDALNRAQERLAQATAADPDFVPAWAWLAIVREYRVAAGMERPNRAMPASRDAAERAMALDPESGAAHLALGIVKLQYDWDWAAAKQHLDRAVEAMPGSAYALQWRARWFRSQGRMDEAIAETARALSLDPLSGSLASDAAAEYLALNQPDRALPYARKAVDLNPGDLAARAALANILWLAGQQDQARQMVDGLRHAGAAGLSAAQLAALQARMGEPDEARQLLDAAEDLPDEELLPAVDYARLAAELEDWDRFFSWTEEAYGERDVELPYWPGSPLVPKSDPRFDAFREQMNLPAAESR